MKPNTALALFIWLRTAGIVAALVMSSIALALELGK